MILFLDDYMLGKNNLHFKTRSQSHIANTGNVHPRPGLVKLAPSYLSGPSLQDALPCRIDRIAADQSQSTDIHMKWIPEKASDRAVRCLTTSLRIILICPVATRH